MTAVGRKLPVAAVSGFASSLSNGTVIPKYSSPDFFPGAHTKWPSSSSDVEIIDSAGSSPACLETSRAVDLPAARTPGAKRGPSPSAGHSGAGLAARGMSGDCAPRETVTGGPAHLCRGAKTNSHLPLTSARRAVMILVLGVWRSPVAHLVWDQGVQGSNPCTPTKY